MKVKAIILVVEASCGHEVMMKGEGSLETVRELLTQVEESSDACPECIIESN